MAQTIALQRGTTTVSGNSTSTATLFTQSGGIATRVIVNQLTFTFNSATSGSQTILGVYHTSSGGQTSLIGIFRNSQNGLGYQAIQFAVGSATNNGFTATSISSTSNLYPQMPCIGHTQSGDMSGTGPGNISFSYSDSSNTRFSTLPSNFYIGPSDSIIIKAQALDGGGSPVTVTASYSFTTITES